MWPGIKVPRGTAAVQKKVLKTMESISKWATNLSKKTLFGLLKMFYTHYSEQNSDDDDDTARKKERVHRKRKGEK